VITTNPSKPPYRVPSMAEIKAIPWNGFKVVSTFSGCGGSCLGYRMAGFKVVWASEFVPAAQEVYRLNHPSSILDTRDIRKVQPAEILKAINLRIGEIDLLDGSPPCASFSTAGKRSEGWGKVKAYSDTRQRVDDLFFEFARLLDGLQPRTFVAENVSGLVKGVSKGYFLEILKTLKGCGYRVEAKVLDAQWLGVPQMRQRLIFIGVRSDLGLKPAFPKPLPYRYSVRDALPWISDLESYPYEGGDSWKVKGGQKRPAPTVPTSPHNSSYVRHQVEAAVGQKSVVSRIRVAKGFKKEVWVDAGAAISPTIGAGPAFGCKLHNNGGKLEVTHSDGQTERRKFSIAELKRICAFPDDFKLTGTYAQQWERLGRAVPPLMMRAIAEAVRDGVLSRIGG
jgi:DNA (cytosine-5)-methyltransferase 1